MAGGEGSGGFAFKRPRRDEGKKMMEGVEMATRPPWLTPFFFLSLFDLLGEPWRF